MVGGAMVGFEGLRSYLLPNVLMALVQEVNFCLRSKRNPVAPEARMV